MSASDPVAAGVYGRLGVRRVINAADTYTMFGGGRLPQSVTAAMAEAASHHVDIAELMDAAGAHIAELTHNPAALVVDGAAAGLAVSAAAVIAGVDPAAVGMLPDSRSSRTEIVVLRSQRNPYDRAVLAAGATLVEAGFADGTSDWQLDAAIADRTAAVLWYAGDQFERYSPSLEHMAEYAHSCAVPLIVDAAAQVPPVSNLWTYRERGADLVLFSGGKGLKGPQSSGLIVGEPALIAACAANSYPFHSVGRAMKSSKENVIGLVAAIERAVSLDWEAEYSRWSDVLTGYRERLDSLPGVATWIDSSGRLGQECPRLFFSWDGPLAAEQLATAVAEGDPSVRIGTGEGSATTAYLNPYSLLPDEEELVIERVASWLAS